ncbi:response regulator [Flavobacterium alvei]|uniref:Response regulator n=1 Tax=Flavobacterium alvei TaxID=2080416 RepID=A0A2S5AE94_9FLAO|nr:response regulator [Flavobacterium alvei]POY40884.1 response regulator [Flavobacterium alvei]
MLNKILCIDDDQITLMLCKMVIAKATFSNEIATAKNGEDALNFFDTLKTSDKTITKPELIFLDLNMPIMNGWEFLEAFNTEKYAEFHNTKIIILSSTIDPGDLEKSKKYPLVIDFLPKPISKEMLEYLKDKIQF